MQIYLIGFMGTGKTSTGKELAKLMKRDLLDSDELIVKQEGMSIPEIFDRSGEQGFREIETGIFKKLSEESHEYVISCGGGAPLRAENVSFMRKNGLIVRLTAESNTVYSRVKGDTGRPLLQSQNPLERIKSLMTEREDAYNKASDITIKTDLKTPEQVAAEICEILTK